VKRCVIAIRKRSNGERRNSRHGLHTTPDSDCRSSERAGDSHRGAQCRALLARWSTPNGDRTASLSFYRNRAKCHGCDADSMSVIDLVIKHEEFEPSRALREATAWICARWPVPTIAKNAKLSRRNAGQRPR